MSNNKIAFLLGSGISLGAGMPSTNDITIRVLSGEGVIYESDGTYYFNELNKSIEPPDDHVWRITALLKRIRSEVDSYYQNNNNHTTNYEHLYYICAQINDTMSGEYDNPVIQPFIEKITPEVNQLIIIGQDSVVEWNFHRLIKETLNYIRDVAWRLLLKEPENLDYLNCIIDSCSDTLIKKIDIYTLNHDTILESVFAQKNILPNMGFTNYANGVRYWDFSLFENNNAKVNLLKLHGSINWFRFPINYLTSAPVGIGIPETWDIWGTFNPDGKRQYPEEGRPEFLAGTFNKMLQYTSGIYADLFSLFRIHLKDTNTLIVCGYGFGDKGINAQIIDWMYISSIKKMIIINQEPDGLLERSRGAIKNNWGEWINQRKIRIVQKWIEDCSWDEIKNLCIDVN